MNAAGAEAYGAIEAQMAASKRKQDHVNWSVAKLFLTVGVLLFSVVSILPVANGIYLLGRTDYVFFVGAFDALALVVSPILVISLYVVTVVTFFTRQGRPRDHIEHPVALIATLFTFFFGFALFLAALPLWRHSQETIDQIIWHCETSQQTHLLFEYSQVLQDLRGRPHCVDKYSIEECRGFQTAEPFTQILKDMEFGYQCAGFCYHAAAWMLPPQGSEEGARSSRSNAASMISTAPLPPSLAQIDAKAVAHSKTNLAQIDVEMLARSNRSSSLVQIDSARSATAAPPNTYPPTLFSDKNFQSACDQQAARHLQHVGNEIGWQTYYLGIYLITVAFIVYLAQLFRYCIYREKDVGNHDIVT